MRRHKSYHHGVRDIGLEVKNADMGHPQIDKIVGSGVLVEQKIKRLFDDAKLKLQHGPVKILYKDGKPVESQAGTGPGTITGEDKV